MFKILYIKNNLHENTAGKRKGRDIMLAGWNEIESRFEELERSFTVPEITVQRADAGAQETSADCRKAA